MKSPAACALFLILLSAPGVLAQGQLLATDRSELTDLPDAAAGWERIGGGYALLLDDGTLAVNDNSNADRIAFQQILPEVGSEQELRVRASVRVISNLGGAGATLELARPGLEIIARLYPDHIVLGERDASGAFQWLGQVAVDLGELRELELRKTAASVAPEQALLLVDGAEALRVTPRAAGSLGVGRVLFGSLSNADMGATIWDWIEWESFAANHAQSERCSVGQLKARFAN